MDEKRKAEGLPPLGPLRGKDNATPVKVSLALPEFKTSPTLSTHSLKKDPCCTSDPLGSALIKTLTSSQCPVKGREIVRPASPLPTLGPHLTHHIPILHVVDSLYIPPNLRTCQNILITGLLRSHGITKGSWDYCRGNCNYASLADYKELFRYHL